MAKPKAPTAKNAPLAPGPNPGAKVVARRSAEWREHQLRWRFLLDSLEGGDRYRQAIYGRDHRGMPVRNLIRHKREYPEPSEVSNLASFGANSPPGTDPAFAATDDDYELRRARTPVPTFMAEAVSDHLDRVFAREVEREGPDLLDAWWADVDGQGTPIDAWVHKTLAPMLLALGQLDVLLDRPAAPDDEPVHTKADELRLGLDRCVATFILPENMVWWRLDRDGGYAECLVREYPCNDDVPDATSGPAVTQSDTANYRHWTATESVLYDAKGKELARKPHLYQTVPIRRLFTAKKPRCRHVGQSAFEGFAEHQREFYNRDSELILSDTLQAHPLLQGPEDYINPDGSVPVGPGWLLPKKKSASGGTTTYEGFDFVDPPKGAAESIRLNKRDLRDAMDRDSATNKPAGSGGTGSGVVSQSGLSKSFDNARLNNKLSGIAAALATAEKALAMLALVVLGVQADPEVVSIEYSRQFDLSDVEDLGQFLGAILAMVENPAAAMVPTLTVTFLGMMVRQAVPGRDDATYDAWDLEIAGALAKAGATVPATDDVTPTKTGDT